MAHGVSCKSHFPHTVELWLFLRYKDVVPAPHSNTETPVMRQYLEIKEQYPDTILLFRMGDFYEMFFDDATTVGPILDIAVTSRDRNSANPVPMAGVPYHAVGGYLRTLVERGFKVAICEQMETPEQARQRKGAKIVRREVVRLVTPGILVDEEHLRSGEPNYVVSVVCGQQDALGIAALDISCGDFTVLKVPDLLSMRAELTRLHAREILAEPTFHDTLRNELGPECPRLEGVDNSWLPEKQLQAHLDRVRALHQESGGALLTAEQMQAAAWVLAYAEKSQPGQTLLLHRLRVYEPSLHLALDETSLRNLEIFRTLRDQQRKGSLLWAVDATRTAMGARMLRSWLGAPLRQPSAILARQVGIETLLMAPRVRMEFQERLKDVRDIVRLAARARLGTIQPRELAALRNSLAVIPALQEKILELSKSRLDKQLPAILQLGEDTLEDVYRELEGMLVDEPPTHTRDGGIIREGADAELDRQRKLRDGGRDALAAIETRERERTGINNLRVQHNRVFGYFIEISKSQLSRVPKEYVRKQTLANGERFVTSELAEHESQVLAAQSLALAREQELFLALRESVSQAGERLCELGERLACLDVLAGFAEIAERHGYVKPELCADPVLEIEEGRHPVIERLLEHGQFVPNSLHIRAHAGEGQVGRFLLITGPNMGGKSTVMRQSALIALLAHTGSFVPAVRVRIGMIDRIFTRVGAADDLGRGDSTFMIEMRETAQILSQASDRSLILLDEIGRGTATYDGLALAWSITEFLHDQIACRTLFATHYHELCNLSQQLAGLRNMHMAVHEQRGKIIFLHRLEVGAAERSYGIHVGRLAGLPASVLRRAQRILSRLENSDRTALGPQLDLFMPTASTLSEPESSVRTDLFASHRQVMDELVEIHPDELSPRQAHERLRNLYEQIQPTIRRSIPT